MTGCCSTEPHCGVTGRDCPAGSLRIVVSVLALIWHGRGPRESHVLAPLREELTHRRHAVLTPDWDGGDEHAGRAVLLASLETAKRQARAVDSPLVLVGWSLGGSAAVSVALAPGGEVAPIAGIVGLAAGLADQSPISGEAPLAAPTESLAMPVWLVHGSRDPVVPVQRSLDFCARHQARCTLSVVDTDHAGVIGARYDPVLKHCVPSRSPHARRGLAAAVAAIETAGAADRPATATG